MAATDQIRQMVNFILQEAHEKANEIRVKVGTKCFYYGRNLLRYPSGAGQLFRKDDDGLAHTENLLSTSKLLGNYLDIKFAFNSLIGRP